MKTVFTVNLINEKGETTYSTDFFDKTEAMMYIKRTETANALEGLQAVIKQYGREEKHQELLANYTSEELLHEVHRRNNIYISGWWNSDHILDNTGLPTQYHNAFFSYCNKYPLEDTRDIREPVEHWLESAKEDIKAIIMDWFNSTTQHVYNNLKLFDFISNRLEICYEDDLEFYPFIDLSYKKEDGDAEDIQNTIIDLITVFEPHQGNLKTHLEERMQELINEYFSF